MKKNKKTFNPNQQLQTKKMFKFHKSYNISKFPHNKKLKFDKNNNMGKINNSNKDKCRFHVMPSQISDNDISALFNGLLNVIKKKFELDSQAQFININYTIEQLKVELKNKINECNRLKNEIIFLKSQIPTESK